MTKRVRAGKTIKKLPKAKPAKGSNHDYIHSQDSDNPTLRQAREASESIRNRKRNRRKRTNKIKRTKPTRT